MVIAVHQPQYLPWLGYFHKILKSDCFVFLDKVQYKHREYQNRNKIRTKDGWMWLTVPIVSKRKGRQLICDVRIENSINWQEKHWHSLRTCYGKSKYFRNFAPFFEEVYCKKKWESLVDLNVYIIKYILNQLAIKTPLYFESSIGTTKKSTERIIEICKKRKADIYLSGLGGKEYLDEEQLRKNHIKLVYQDFMHPKYKQRHEPFIPNMSIIDLLFNQGKDFLVILEKK